MYNKYFIEPINHFCSTERIKAYPRLVLLGSIALVFIYFATLENDHSQFNGNLIGEDFLVFYTAGRFLIEGHWQNFYDLEAQQLFQKTLVGSQQKVGPFMNPPFAALLYAMFAQIGRAHV